VPNILEEIVPFIQSLLHFSFAMSRIATYSVLSVFGVFSRTMDNEYAERMGSRSYLERLAAHFRIAK
jgi:hypothetical protein